MDEPTSVEVAGKELDALIHKKVMESSGHVLNYSSSIAAAWQVVEKLGLKVGKNGRDWMAQNYWDQSTVVSVATTASLAICRAALKVMEDVK